MSRAVGSNAGIQHQQANLHHSVDLRIREAGCAADHILINIDEERCGNRSIS